MSYTHLKTGQINQLCRSIIEESINMHGVDLIDVDSQLLANAVVRIKIVDICSTHLTTDQVNALFRTIIEEKEGIQC